MNSVDTQQGNREGNLQQLAGVGTATWLDDLSRQRLNSGDISAKINDLAVAGVTTNPAIFSAAMTAGEDYDPALAELTKQGASASEAVFAMAIEDVQRACDEFHDVFVASGGQDGRVSIEVDPRYADDYQETITQARDLWRRVDRPNAMIKIPATEASLAAVTDAIAEGICVNVTLIFSLPQYVAVIEAYLAGLERAHENGVDLSKIHSVASFFISRVDTEVDKRLEALGTDAALELRGKAGIANARLAYAWFTRIFSEDEPQWSKLSAAGARPQRPLWASTGVKNPDYPADLYVTQLAGPQTVNTMPEKTMLAFQEASIPAITDTLSGREAESKQIMDAVAAAGIDWEDVFDVLGTEGVDKFVASWQELLDSITARIEQLN